MFRYNAKLYVLTLPTLVFDPLVKLLLGGFAGLAAVAYFEIANRLLQQVNALILRRMTVLLHHSPPRQAGKRDG